MEELNNCHQSHKERKTNIYKKTKLRTRRRDRHETQNDYEEGSTYEAFQGREAEIRV